MNSRRIWIETTMKAAFEALWKGAKNESGRKSTRGTDERRKKLRQGRRIISGISRRRLEDLEIHEFLKERLQREKEEVIGNATTNENAN
jgi:hypothetical protein